MERTKFTDKKILTEPISNITLSIHLYDTLLKEPKGGDLIALYSFYYYTAKRQKTNQPKATDSFCQKGLDWGYSKFVRAKKKLIELDLIKPVQSRKNGKVAGWYIRVIHIWKQTTLNLIKSNNVEILELENTRTSKILELENQRINALRKLNKNALRKHTPTFSSGSIIPSKKKPSIIERNKKYLPTAEYLSKIIQSTKNIQHTPANLKQWSGEIRKLCETNKIELKRINKALQWYKRNVGGEYIPVIESGSSLREKFIRLEDAVKRKKHNYKPQSKITIGYHEEGKKYTRIDAVV